VSPHAVREAAALAFAVTAAAAIVAGKVFDDGRRHLAQDAG